MDRCPKCGGAKFTIIRDPLLRFEPCECETIVKCPKCKSTDLDLIRYDDYHSQMIFKCGCGHEFKEDILD